MKNREEEIKQKARELALDWNVGRGNELYYRLDKLVEIARWADEHPVDANKATMIVQSIDAWIDAKEHKPEAVEQKEFGARKLSRQVLCVYDDGKCHVERYDHDCNCWRWANGYGQMHEPKMWRYIDIPEGGMK